MATQDFIESFRRASLEHVASKTESFGEAWKTWRHYIGALTDDMNDAEGIFELGADLREVFRTTSTERGQSEVSKAGDAWECLVCWYLNCVLQDTRSVVIHPVKSLRPGSLSDAISINYKNKPTNSESDLIGITFPEIDLDEDEFDISTMDKIFSKNLSEFSIHVLQCKTNWNENAQVPMLWDLVYKSKGFEASGITIGKNGRSFHDLRNFTYGFVTVPTNNTSYHGDLMPVRRVADLSGHNYWGMESKDGVAWSISNMFKLTFGDEVIGDVREHIENLISAGKISLNLD